MRENKFKWVGKNISVDKIMMSGPITTTDILEGSYLSFFSLNNRRSDYYTEGNCEFIAEILYTGLKDKNGKEIYEGDIMVSSNNKPKTEMIGEVYFEGGQFRVQYKDRYPKEGDRKDFYLSSGFDGSNWEVIGNVYENSELLKT